MEDILKTIETRINLLPIPRRQVKLSVTEGVLRKILFDLNKEIDRWNRVNLLFSKMREYNISYTVLAKEAGYDRTVLSLAKSGKQIMSEDCLCFFERSLNNLIQQGY